MGPAMTGVAADRISMVALVAFQAVKLAVLCLACRQGRRLFAMTITAECAGNIPGHIDLRRSVRRMAVHAVLLPHVVGMGLVAFSALLRLFVLQVAVGTVEFRVKGGDFLHILGHRQVTAHAGLSGFGDLVQFSLPGGVSAMTVAAVVDGEMRMIATLVAARTVGDSFFPVWGVLLMTGVTADRSTVGSALILKHADRILMAG